MKYKANEKQTQRAILDYLELIGAVAVKFNNVGIRKADGGYIPPRQLGISDILACYKGIFIAIEVKSTGCKPTQTQYDFLDLVERAGGEAIWTDNLNDVINLIAKL